MTKTCRRCGITKARTAFPTKGAVCQACRNIDARQHYAVNRKQILARQKAGRRGPRYSSAAWRRYKYGFAPDEFDEMLAAQGGRCALGHELRGAPVVDHDHTTGAVRGLTCGACNCALGLLRDDPDLCDAAAAYLEPHRDGLQYASPSDIGEVPEWPIGADC